MVVCCQGHALAESRLHRRLENPEQQAIEYREYDSEQDCPPEAFYLEVIHHAVDDHYHQGIDDQYKKSERYDSNRKGEKYNDRFDKGIYQRQKDSYDNGAAKTFYLNSCQKFRSKIYSDAVNKNGINHKSKPG